MNPPTFTYLLALCPPIHLRNPPPAQVSTFAMFVDAGSMYESADEEGACHFLETTAFKGTKTKSAAEVLEFQTRQGIGSSAVFNREVVMFKVDTLRSNTGEA
jgi:predicted Zn-dependent peptidase